MSLTPPSFLNFIGGDILQKICLFAVETSNGMRHAQLVCRLWHALCEAQGQEVWRSIATRQWPGAINSKMRVRDNDWKRFFLANYARQSLQATHERKRDTTSPLSHWRNRFRYRKKQLRQILSTNKNTTAALPSATTNCAGVVDVEDLVVKQGLRVIRQDLATAPALPGGQTWKYLCPIVFDEPREGQMSFCAVCSKGVYSTNNTRELKNHASQAHCVFIDF